MNRTMTMIVALSLMGGTAAFAQPDPGSKGQDEQPNCGQPNQPACETDDQKDNKKKNKGKKPDGQQDQPAGAQGQPPADQGTPPAGGPRGRQQGGQQDQPGATGQQQGPQGQQGQPPQGQGPQGPTAPQPSGPAGPPAGGPQTQPQDGQQGASPRGQAGPRRDGQQDQTPGGQYDRRRGGPQDQTPGTQFDQRRDGQYGPPRGGARWSRGERVPQEYRRDEFYVRDWQRNNFPPPPRGTRWMCYDRGNCFLVQSNTGFVIRVFIRDDRDYSWRRRYARTYSYNDDRYYRDCRGRSDPAGILVGGLIGGLIGRSIGDERAGPTFAGIIIGGTIGAALSRDLDCDDRSFAYRSYYDAFNSGRVGRVYLWRNPRSNYRGAFVVRAYYYDEDGFRCARYRHTSWTPRRRQVDGFACRQPDGAWAFIR